MQKNETETKRKRKSETKIDGIEKYHGTTRAKGYSLFSAAPQKSPKKWEKKTRKNSCQLRTYIE